MLETTSKIRQSNHYPYIAIFSTKPQQSQFQGLQFKTISRAGCSSVDHTFSEVIFFLISSLTILWQNLRLFLFVLSLVTWEKILIAASFKMIAESDKVSPEPPFLQVKQLQLPQLLLCKTCTPDPSPALLPFFGYSLLLWAGVAVWSNQIFWDHAQWGLSSQ